MPETYLTTEQAAAHLNFSRQRLEKWRCTGGGPKFIKVGASVRYSRADLDAFMDASRVGSTSERPKEVA